MRKAILAPVLGFALWSCTGGSVDEELSPHQVQVRLADEKIGRLYGGQRTIVH